MNSSSAEGEEARYSMVLTSALDNPSGSLAWTREKWSASASAVRVVVLISGVASRMMVEITAISTGSPAGSAIDIHVRPQPPRPRRETEAGSRPSTSTASRLSARVSHRAWLCL